MSKSVLHLYLKKLADGDTSYAAKVCYRLANRLIYVPAHSKTKDKLVVCETPVINELGKRCVPMFTSESLFTQWVKSNSSAYRSLSLLGADFCAALDVTTYIRIDPGSDHEVELTPEQVDEIACTSMEEPLQDGVEPGMHASWEQQPPPDDRGNPEQLVKQPIPAKSPASGDATNFHFSPLSANPPVEQQDNHNPDQKRRIRHNDEEEQSSIRRGTAALSASQVRQVLGKEPITDMGEEFSFLSRLKDTKTPR